MRFRFRPFFQAFDGLIDFGNDHTDISQISFCLTSAEIIIKRFGQFLFIGLYSDFQPPQLFNTPGDIERFSLIEERTLRFNCRMDCIFIPHKMSSLYGFIIHAQRKLKQCALFETET